MALQHHTKNTPVTRFFNKIPEYVQTGGKIIGTIKGIYDLGSTSYSAAQYAAPLVSAIV